MVKFPSQKAEKQANSYGMNKVYELEDIGIIRNEPQKVDGEMQMCIAPNFEKIDEWLNNRTIDGKKLTKKQGETVDQFVYFVFVATTQDSDKITNVFEKRMNDPQFIKWKDKQARKYHWKFSALSFVNSVNS